MRCENACPLYQNQSYMYKNKVKMNETKSNYSKYDYKTIYNVHLIKWTENGCKVFDHTFQQGGHGGLNCLEA